MNFKLIFLEEVYVIALDSYYIFTKTGNIQRGIEYYVDIDSLILAVLLTKFLLYGGDWVLQAMNHWNKVRH